MNLQTAKIELVKTILESENKDFIKKVVDFIKAEKSDFWDELSESQKLEINEGIGQLDRGERVSLESVLKKIS
ncbi:MAG: hypothetical protein QMC21_03585 [Flavobacteriales bacterium]|jgi:hypothetical protein|tara:strand:- start:1059 stop:1277 length:219 start_codon:yes stop_codon:yes gene_type:complete